MSATPQPTQTGQVVIISGPSGVGKSTLLRLLFERCPLALESSISATTRAPRPGEVNGGDYYFLGKQEFADRRQRGEFLECFEVFGRGDWYGTLQSEVAPRLTAGKWVVLEIDVQGAMSVLEQYPDALTIFVLPGNVDDFEQRLSQRLKGRATETPEAIQKRLDTARFEMAYADQYKHRVVNENIDDAVRDICTILTQQSQAQGRQA
ncbi:MAG: guanylate kinase [Planctomycetes bacterium]|nr:guanylate kinase [Planctomycetota bacterium]